MRKLSMLFLLTVTAAATAQDTGPEVLGTVNEVMIGITFPSSNILGEATYQDPASLSDGVFDAYAGWIKVETAAIAMAESANLLAVPGRQCSNGEPAPVESEDWMDWVEELRSTAMAAYSAARMQDAEALMGMSEQLSASCSACHGRYVDMAEDPSDRCK